MSGDVEEAVRSVVEVDADEFGHEVVKRIMYQALQLAADPNDPNALQRSHLRLVSSSQDKLVEAQISQDLGWNLVAIVRLSLYVGSHSG